MIAMDPDAQEQKRQLRRDRRALAVKVECVCGRTVGRMYGHNHPDGFRQGEFHEFSAVRDRAKDGVLLDEVLTTPGAPSRRYRVTCPKCGTERTYRHDRLEAVYERARRIDLRSVEIDVDL